MRRSPYIQNVALFFGFRPASPLRLFHSYTFPSRLGQLCAVLYTPSSSCFVFEHIVFSRCLSFYWATNPLLALDQICSQDGNYRGTELRLHKTRPPMALFSNLSQLFQSPEFSWVSVNYPFPSWSWISWISGRTKTGRVVFRYHFHSGKLLGLKEGSQVRIPAQYNDK